MRATKSHIVKLFFLLLALFLLFGCTAKEPAPLPQEPVYKKDFHKSHKLSLKYPIFLIADNQYNNIYTDPVIFRNGYADDLTQVAIRPPQLDIYAQELFNWTLGKYSAKDHIVIHLGDALNIACLNEWRRFENSLKNIDMDKFAMVPGNHDFYWYGVSAGQGSSPKQQWAIACDNRYPIESEDANCSKRFTKGKFIKHYLDLIPLKYDGISSGEYKASSANDLVKRIYVKRFIDEHDEFSSFLVQDITLPSKSSTKALKGIIIDTSTYDERPLNFLGHFEIKGYKNPGERAGITQKQKEIIEKWIKEYTSKKEQFMVFGHHPLREFDSIDKAWMINLIKNNKYALGYISAHTHLGYVEQDKVTEVNVGSITDYPNEIRTLEINPRSGKLSAKLHQVRENKLGESLWCEARYDYTTAPIDNYLSYKLSKKGIYSAHHTHETTFDVAITTYLRLFRDLHAVRHFSEDSNLTAQYNRLMRQAKVIRATKCFSSIGTAETPNILFFDIENNNDFAKTVACRSHKLEMVKSLSQLNENIKAVSTEYKAKVQEYGSCQALRASKAEWIGNHSNGI